MQMRPNWNKHQGKESLSLVNLRHNHSRTLFLTPMKALHRCLHLSPSLLEKKKIPPVSDSSPLAQILSLFFLSSISSLQHSLPLPLHSSRTSYPDTRTFKWKPPYFPVLSSSSLSSHFTPLFLFSAFLPCCLP